MKIYTKTGDAGTTALVGGSRVAKEDCRLEAYGTVDELNSHLGLLLSLPQPDAAQERLLQGVQNRLFDLGAYLATPADKAEGACRVGADDVALLEEAIDGMDALLEPLRCFILPGGCPLAAQANVARAVCRRAERRVAALNSRLLHDGHEPLAPGALRYLNRLSDYLFTLARFYNHLRGAREIPWQPKG